MSWLHMRTASCRRLFQRLTLRSQREKRCVFSHPGVHSSPSGGCAWVTMATGVVCGVNGLPMRIAPGWDTLWGVLKICRENNSARLCKLQLKIVWRQVQTRREHHCALLGLAGCFGSHPLLADAVTAPLWGNKPV